MSTRSPIFIEIIGTPAAGKTTLAAKLHHYFNNSGVLCTIAEEPAERYPGPPQDKLQPEFNEWTLLESLMTIDHHRTLRQYEVVIFDRGVFDSLYWLSWFHSSRGWSNKSYENALQRSRTGARLVNIAIMLTCDFEAARQRRPGGGRILNPGIYPQLLSNYHKPGVAEEIGLATIPCLRIDTSELNIGSVERRVRSFLDTPIIGDKDAILASLVKAGRKS